MKPHNSSRRRLLGGLVAGLFGWLLPRKAPATPRHSSDKGGYTREERSLSTYSMTSYNQEGKVIQNSGPITREVINTYYFDSQHRLISITQSYGPCTWSS
jgi:hypothetical protein